MLYGNDMPRFSSMAVFCQPIWPEYKNEHLSPYIQSGCKTIASKASGICGDFMTESNVIEWGQIVSYGMVFYREYFSMLLWTLNRMLDRG